MSKTIKSAAVVKRLGGKDEMALVNAQTLTPLTEEEVFLFRVAAADDRVDRDGERFPPETLREMAERYPGKPMLLDHNWRVKSQTARVYAADVETGEDHVTRLILRAYMLRTPETKSAIAAIEGGILREVSVGLMVDKSLCSICGQPFGSCEHRKGESYNGSICHVELRGASDVYEVSFVAVPAQKDAGIIKHFDPAEPEQQEFLQRRAEALQLQEEYRF